MSFTFDIKAASKIMKPLYSEERLKRDEDRQREVSEFFAKIRFLPKPQSPKGTP